MYLQICKNFEFSLKIFKCFNTFCCEPKNDILTVAKEWKIRTRWVGGHSWPIASIRFRWNVFKLAKKSEYSLLVFVNSKVWMVAEHHLKFVKVKVFWEGNNDMWTIVNGRKRAVSEEFLSLKHNFHLFVFFLNIRYSQNFSFQFAKYWIFTKWNCFNLWPHYQFATKLKMTIEDSEYFSIRYLKGE